MHLPLPSSRLLLLLCVHAMIGRGQSQSPVNLRNDPLTLFAHYTTRDGLSDPEVLCIFQDRFGFYWIGTRDGLNKFDGFSFRIYRHIAGDPTSLPANLVECIAEDARGDLWIGTAGGLARYRRNSDSFNRFLHDPADTNSLSGNHIRALLADVGAKRRPRPGVADSLLWIETFNGTLHALNPETGHIARYPHDPPNQPDYHYHALTEDRRGKLWLGGRYMPLLEFDKQTKTFRKLPTNPDPNQPAVGNQQSAEDSSRTVNRVTFKREPDVSSYLEDVSGNFYVSGVDGLWLLDRETGAAERLLPVSVWDMASAIRDTASGIRHPASGIRHPASGIWLASGHGLYLYNPATGTFTSFLPDPDNPQSLSSLQVNTVFVDREGTVWAGTDKGLDRLVRHRYPFTLYRHIPGNETTLSSNRVTCLLRDRQGTLWVGTGDQGLNRFDSASGTFTCFRPRPGDAASLAANAVSALFEDSRDHLWVGLWAGRGFQRLNRTTGRFTTYRYNTANVKEDWYNAFAEDSLGNFYLGFWGGPGLTLFDRNRGTFGPFLKERFEDPNSSRLINTLFTDSRGLLWIGTSTTGLYCYDPATGASIHLPYRQSDSTALPGPAVNAILEDANGTIWIGGTGLTKIRDMRFAMSERSGDHDLAWPDEEKAKSQQPIANSLLTISPYHHITIGTGEASNTIVGMEQDTRGNLWLATRNGLFRYDPSSGSMIPFTAEDGLPDNTFSGAHARLATGELLFGGPGGLVHFHPDSLREVPYRLVPVLENLSVADSLRIADLCDTAEIRLRYDENFFTLELAAPGMVPPEGGRYHWRLDPLEKEWRSSGASDRIASYTSVPPGSYTFMAGVTARSGELPSEVRTLRIVIEPPFWQTWWFYLLEALAIIALLAGAFLLREQQLTLRHRTLEMKQKLLRSQMNPHFIFNALFAIQNFIYEQKAAEAGRYLADFAALIRLILDSSRQEFIALDREIRTLRLYLELQQLRFNRSFTYTLETDPGIDAELTAIPPMLTQPFIENALEHGLRHLESPGHLAVRFLLMDEIIRIEVEDNGIGILRAGEQQEAKRKDHESLALAITRERIALLSRNARFRVEFSVTDRSKEGTGGHGTLVRFDIPYTGFPPDATAG